MDVGWMMGWGGRIGERVRVFIQLNSVSIRLDSDGLGWGSGLGWLPLFRLDGLCLLYRCWSQESNVELKRYDYGELLSLVSEKEQKAKGKLQSRVSNIQKIYFKLDSSCWVENAYKI